MNEYDVREFFHIKCKYRGSLVKGSGPRAGPLWLYIENVHDIVILCIKIIFATSSAGGGTNVLL